MKGRGRGRSNLWVALAFSLGAHLLLIALALPLYLGRDEDEGGVTRGVDYVEVTREPPRKAPRPSLNQAVKQQPAPTTRPSLRPAQRDQVAQSQVMPTTQEPTERLAGADAEEPAAAAEAVTLTTSAGHPAGDGDSESLTPGYGALQGSVIPRPECLDGLDNDGDHLIDTEDPECLIAETPAEEAEIRARALMLSDLRRNDLPEGDPDELYEERVTAQLQPDGDGLVYQRGQFRGQIAPDGSVTFGKARRVGLSGSGFSFGSNRQTREKLRFLKATEEIRDQMAERQRAREMKRALIGLRTDLEELWTDRRYSLSQKKTILFQRLDECDRSTAGGREAAQIIADFIRDHSRPPGGKQVAARDSGGGVTASQ